MINWIHMKDSTKMEVTCFLFFEPNWWRIEKSAVSVNTHRNLRKKPGPRKVWFHREILVIPRFHFQCLQSYLSKLWWTYQDTDDAFLKRGLNFSIDLSSWELQKKVSHMSINMHRKNETKVFFFLNNIK